MKTSIAAIATILLAAVFSQYASAESIPDWIKNNAMWWSEGAISQTEFASGLQHLIQIDVLKVPPTTVSSEKSDEIPDWVKNTAAWWAAGSISDNDFVNAVQHLMKIGVISVAPSVEEPKTTTKQVSFDNNLQAELDACQEIKKAYERIKCEDVVEHKIKVAEYKTNSQVFEAGPITFYFSGSELTIMDSGQANLEVRVLAENTGSNDNVVLFCSGPSVCNYDVWNGDKAYKYSSTDFTNGQTIVKPGEAQEVTMLFGPNIGYGGTTFEYDSSKDYFFRVSEGWGNVSIPLNLK